MERLEDYLEGFSGLVVGQVFLDWKLKVSI